MEYGKKSIYQEFQDMVNVETNPDMIDAIWKWDFDKIRQIRQESKPN